MNGGMRLWIVLEHERGHSYYISDGESIVVPRVTKPVAERICKAVNDRPSLVSKLGSTQRKLADAEETVRKLREYIRDNEVNVLRSIKLGVRHEAI